MGLQASNLKQVLKEMENEQITCDPSLLEVKEENKNHYHVVLVNVRAVYGKVIGDTFVRVQHYHKHGFEKIKKLYKEKYEFMFLLHDPSNNKVEKIIPQHVQKKTEEEIRKELQAEFDAKFNKKIAEMKEAANNEEDDTESEQSDINISKIEISDEKIDQLTVVELKEYAKDHDISLVGLTQKEDIKFAIIAWIEEHNSKI